MDEVLVNDTTRVQFAFEHQGYHFDVPNQQSSEEYIDKIVVLCLKRKLVIIAQTTRVYDIR